MPDVRAFAIYFGSTKAFTVNQQSLSIPAGRTAVFGQEGYLAHSKGALQVKLSLTEITPTGGSDFITQLQTKHLLQENVTIKLFIGGKVVSAEMAIVSLEFTSNTESGVASGTGQFEGGIPVIV
jgi:hypothetical protein